MNTYEELASARKTFNNYNDTVVGPLLNLRAGDADKLGFPGVAKRIEDIEIRNHYCELAIKMLDANISHYGPNATPINVPESENTITVVSTLVVAAIGYHFGAGITAGLLAAAAWYWITAGVVASRRRDAERAANEHNDLIAGWVGTVQDWEQSRDELRLLADKELI
jgi:hypothetical protein